MKPRSKDQGYRYERDRRMIRSGIVMARWLREELGFPCARVCSYEERQRGTIAVIPSSHDRPECRPQKLD